MQKITAIIFTATFSLCVVLPCAAQYQCNNFEIILFGRVWDVNSYWVQEDLMKNQNDEVFLEPEGLAYRNGTLYVSGDRDADETDGRLGVYSYPTGGPLSCDSYIQMANVEPDWWGPEGLTFNDSNDPNSYGSNPNQLVSVERDDPCQAGIIDLNSGGVSNKLPVITAPEDITFLTAHNQFAVLTDMETSIELTYYDRSMVTTGETFNVGPGSNGLVAASPSFGSWFTRTDQDDELFIVVAKADPNNTVLAYDLTGNQIDRKYDLPVEPKAQIPLDDWLVLIEPAFGTVEAITVDEANRVLFIGDEDNCMIHVLTPVRLAADLYTDGVADMNDLSEFVSHWLESDCGHPDWCEGSDIDRNTTVDFVDYTFFAAQWGDTESY